MASEETLIKVARSDPKVIVALFALLLLSVFLFEVRPANVAMASQHNEIRAAMATIEIKRTEVEAERDALLKEMRDAMKRSAYLEFRNCLNTARSEQQMTLCAYKD